MKSSQNLDSSSAEDYPRNVVGRTYHPYVVDTISHQLNAQASRLFADEAKAALDFFDLRYNAKAFWPSRIGTAKSLKYHLELSSSKDHDDHLCRFLFIHAAHSRDRLNVSREMLMLCLTHFQVMPEFLAFLYPFGFQLYAQDFNFSGFRQRTNKYFRKPKHSSDYAASETHFQLCYNLKSVEPSDSDDWSIRHCAIYHSFNLEEVQTRWIVVKGNELLRRRIVEATHNESLQDVSDFTSLNRTFKASLETHLIFCDWSAENWRWYINYLEDGLQNMTRMTLSAPVDRPPLNSSDTERLSFRPRINTQETQRSKRSVFSWTNPQASEKHTFNSVAKPQPCATQRYINPDTGVSQPLPPEDDDDDDEEQADMVFQTDGTKVGVENLKFSFGSLRKVHRVAEKANEAVLVLRQNHLILTQLSKYYRSVIKRKELSKDLLKSCGEVVDDFELRIEALENDTQIQILRLESLLRLLGERKTLLHSILDYQNTQLNKSSTKSMVTMTEDMDEIARKTKVETVSMRVITLVTLFFLPGTFISVGRIFLSTLMSTKIFESNDIESSESNPYAHLKPVQIYLALSLPLTVATLLFWAGFHFWEMRNEDGKLRGHRASGWQV